ncbi:RNA-binding, protein, putative [Leishmania tarentolae]|uniref:RNA-binding, protein, putative n=1 Tax=Leishmania tarentolae TaxID=5689 RepID=A0A640KQY0_LEITA|nr:RNA-binding, protein, putative [Leishmania tarentolae]
MKDLAVVDLQNYQLARQLHMLPQLYDVFVSQAMCYPMFYESLHPAVRQLGRVILLSLNRRFNGSAGTTEVPAARRYRLDSVRLVLSFLSFPEYHIDRVCCVSRLIGAAPVSKLELGTPAEGALTAPSGSLEAAPTPSTPRSAGPAIAATTPTELSLAPHVVEDMPSARASGGASPASKPVNLPTAAAASSMTGVTSRPVFFVRPTTGTAHTDHTAPHFGETAHLYVRMVHPHQLNEESLNPYFGRYGQVEVTPLQRIPLQQCAQDLGETATEALLQLFRSTASGDALYVQDFIITVDSHQNALYAVRHAYCKELVCIALHDATAGGGNNTHCLADVNDWMRRHTLVWGLRADPRAIASKTSASPAHSSAAAEKRRKRARAHRRRQDRKMKRHSTLGAAADDTSSTLSSAEEVAGKGPHSSVSSSSSDSSSSPTSDGDSAEVDLEGFVPDIVLDGFPYWTTEDQLKVLLQQYGTVSEMRLSVDDLSGAFTGCVLVRMASVEEALNLSRAVHNTLYRGYSLISGVVNERLEVVSLEDGREVRMQPMPDQVPPDVTLNERVWV